MKAPGSRAALLFAGLALALLAAGASVDALFPGIMPGGTAGAWFALALAAAFVTGPWRPARLGVGRPPGLTWEQGPVYRTRPRTWPASSCGASATTSERAISWLMASRRAMSMSRARRSQASCRTASGAMTLSMP